MSVLAINVVSWDVDLTDSVKTLKKLETLVPTKENNPLDFICCWSTNRDSILQLYICFPMPVPFVATVKLTKYLHKEIPSTRLLQVNEKGFLLVNHVSKTLEAIEFKFGMTD